MLILYQYLEGNVKGCAQFIQRLDALSSRRIDARAAASELTLAIRETALRGSLAGTAGCSERKPNLLGNVKRFVYWLVNFLAWATACFGVMVLEPT